MAKGKPRNAFATLGELAADQANEAERDSKRQEVSGKYTVLNGKRIPLEDIVDHDYVPYQHHKSRFTEVEKFLKEPKPGVMYAWPAKDDPETYGKIRAGVYRPVEMHEVRDDTVVPIQSHIMPAVRPGEEKRSVVCMMDVILVEIPERAVRELYKRREADAALRTMRQDASKNYRSAMEGLFPKGTVRTELHVGGEEE